MLRDYNVRVRKDKQSAARNPQSGRSAEGGVRKVTSGREVMGMIVIALLILALIVVRYWRVLRWTH